MKPKLENIYSGNFVEIVQKFEASIKQVELMSVFQNSWVKVHSKYDEFSIVN